LPRDVKSGRQGDGPLGHAVAHTVRAARHTAVAAATPSPRYASGFSP